MQVTLTLQCLLAVVSCVLLGLRIDSLLLISYRAAFGPAFAAAALPLLLPLLGLAVGAKYNREPFLGYWRRGHGGSGDGMVLLGFTAALIVVSCLPFVSELLIAQTLDGEAYYSAVVMAIPLYIMEAPLLILALVRVISYGARGRT